MMQPGYLKVKQIAAMAGVGVWTVRRWIKTGRLPAYHLSRRIVRIRAEDWERLELELRQRRVREVKRKDA